jgi:hypothetical protein
MTGLQYIHLIAAHGPDLGLPERAGLGMNRQRTVPVAVGEDFRLRSRPLKDYQAARCRRRATAESCPRGYPASAPSSAGVVLAAIPSRSVAVADGHIEHGIGLKKIFPAVPLFPTRPLRKFP